MIKNTNGFTLVELLATIAVLVLLATLIVPKYYDYIARSQVSESLLAISEAKKVLLGDFVSNEICFNDPNQKIQQGKYGDIFFGGTYKPISSESLPTDHNGCLIIYKFNNFSNQIEGKVIIVKILYNGSYVNTKSGIDPIYTTVPVRYLPKDLF